MNSSMKVTVSLLSCWLLSLVATASSSSSLLSHFNDNGVVVTADDGPQQKTNNDLDQVLSRNDHEDTMMVVTANDDTSNCNVAPNKEQCYKTVDDTTNTVCNWCEAGAIPSECMSQNQASQLPSGVFDCTSPSSSSNHDDDHHHHHHSGDDTTNRSTGSLYEFVPGRTHSIRAGPVGTSRTGGGGGDGDADVFCDDSSKSISGYMDVTGSKYDADGENKHLFFWMFEKRGVIADDTPFVIWLTGGPGCSSTLALLTENGPCSVNKDGATTTVNPNSWTEVAHVLWLDQPAGVGFSYGEETDSNEEMISEDAYYFLQAFFQTYPQYASNPLYVTGESYAGHYVPAISYRIYVGNQQVADNHGTNGSGGSSTLLHLNLSGLAIGNGLTAPELQYPSYPEMAYNNSHGLKVINEETYEAMKAIIPACTAMIHKCNAGDSIIDDFACQSAFITCNMGLTSPYQATGLNPYDIRKQCEVPPLCYDFSHVTKWLHSSATKTALHVDTHHSHSWSSCNFGINMKFHSDWMKDFSHDIAALLDHAGIPVLIYVGDVDFICNYIGNEAWTYNLQWHGTSEFQGTPLSDWKNGQGTIRSAQNLTYLTIKDGGHMVPADQPEIALDMLSIFLSGGSF